LPHALGFRVYVRGMVLDLTLERGQRVIGGTNTVSPGRIGGEQDGRRVPHCAPLFAACHGQ
jgi:hypothetical protein